MTPNTQIAAASTQLTHKLVTGTGLSRRSHHSGLGRHMCMSNGSHHTNDTGGE
ncbi:hypothetical protein BD779DRAFT_1493166 [Infundibulicybe gibba]|nr:hypothetical protein BD779DRAFT_1493166 [Infundibulicybe gibba]